MSKVVVFGSLNTDTCVRVRRLPGPGETMLATSRAESFGGKGANQALAAAAAGAAVEIVGRVGADAAGESYLRHLSRNGVGVAGIAIDRTAATGQAFILVDDHGENEIVVMPGANANVGPDDADRLGLRPGDFLLAQLELPIAGVAAAVERAARLEALVILNLSPFTDLPVSLLRRCDLVIVNEHEAKQLSHDIIGPNRVIKTLGARGATWNDLNVPAPATDVVDTTGAGDVFAGALVASLAKGVGNEEALFNAVRAAASAVTVPGAQLARAD